MEPQSYDGWTDDAIFANELAHAQQERASDTSAEVADIERLMGNRQSAYWRGPDAEKMQARYRELLGAQEQGQAQHAPGEQDTTQGTGPAQDEPLQLPAHNFNVPGEFAEDELAQTFASLAGAAGLPANLVDDVFSSRMHGGELARDTTDRAEGLAELRQVWGDNTSANIATVRAFINNNLPPHIADALLAPARHASGMAILNNPAFMVHMLAQARRGARLNDGSLQDIEAAMRTPAYRSDPAAQVRYQYLLRQRGGR